MDDRREPRPYTRIRADKRVARLEFNHCWNNIRLSQERRPLARNKISAKQLFDKRVEVYCLADWHFVVKPDLTSYDIASQIYEEVFS